MRKIIAIFGIVLIITILVSGSAVATWVYVTWIDEDYTSNTNEINGPPDAVSATLGQNGPPLVLGWILLDLGSGNEMPPSQDFTVFADSTALEEYNVSVAETLRDDAWYLGSGEDTANHTFTTPSESGHQWRYIIIRAWSGLSGGTGDGVYGPEIDAVGWDKP